MGSQFFEDLKAIRYTLDKVSVSGSENFDKMLGCIQKLDEMIAAIKEGEAHAHQDE